MPAEFKKLEDTMNRARKAESFKKEWFREMKKLLDKPDEDFIIPGILEVKVISGKTAVRERRLIKFLYASYLKKMYQESQMTKAEFQGFIKVFLKDITEP